MNRGNYCGNGDYGIGGNVPPAKTGRPAAKNRLLYPRSGFVDGLPGEPGRAFLIFGKNDWENKTIFGEKHL